MLTRAAVPDRLGMGLAGGEVTPTLVITGGPGRRREERRFGETDPGKHASDIGDMDRKSTVAGARDGQGRASHQRPQIKSRPGLEGFQRRTTIEDPINIAHRCNQSTIRGYHRDRTVVFCFDYPATNYSTEQGQSGRSPTTVSRYRSEMTC